MVIPGLQDLLRDIKRLEDYAKAYQSRDEAQILPITSEEAEVIRSYRRFLAQEDE